MGETREGETDILFGETRKREKGTHVSSWLDMLMPAGLESGYIDVSLI